MHHQAASDHGFAALVGGGGAAAAAAAGGLVFSEPSQILPWPTVHSFNPIQIYDHDPFLFSPPPSSSSTTTTTTTTSSSSSSSYAAGFFTRRPGGHPFLHQLGYDVGCPDQLRILSDALGPMVQPGSAPFGLQAELSKMTAQEIMDAKALAASKSHSEAERRRRERINNHLAKLRSILPSTTKTDKASLLAEVIQHVKELKRQTSLIAETSSIPTETDELIVADASDEPLQQQQQQQMGDGNNKFVIKASVCCEDRSDLLPDLIKTLKALRLKTLKAEITTLGGRVKNVLFITGEESDPNSNEYDQGSDHQWSISSIQETLKAVMEKSAAAADDSTSGNAKRQRTNITNNNNNML
ncbi:Transcription factor bHLH30 [Dionaea muscipula]